MSKLYGAPTELGGSPQAIKEVVTPYTLTQEDSGYFLVFNDAGSATLNIPDGLDLGTSVVTNNIGGGVVVATMTGSDVIRANGASGSAATLADAFSYMAVTKIASTTWQGSER